MNSGEIDVFLLQIRSSQPRLSRGDGGDAPFCFGQGKVCLLCLYRPILVWQSRLQFRQMNTDSGSGEVANDRCP